MTNIHSKSKYSSFKRVENIAEKNSSLGKLLQRANSIMAYQETVRATLEPSCRAHCWLANYRNGTLYLQTDSSAWGTRLRMQQRAIIQQLKPTRVFASLHSIKVLIQPSYTVAATQRKAKPISTDNAKQLLETAEQTDDEALKAALTHLAQTSRNRRKSDDS
ncbi:MAG: DUF721 domain-containing protein [Pseudomonadales bacterium]